MLLGRLADRDRQAERVSLGAGRASRSGSGDAGGHRSTRQRSKPSSRTRPSGCRGQGGRTTVESKGVRGMLRPWRLGLTSRLSRGRDCSPCTRGRSRGLARRTLEIDHTTMMSIGPGMPSRLPSRHLSFRPGQTAARRVEPRQLPRLTARARARSRRSGRRSLIRCRTWSAVPRTTRTLDQHDPPPARPSSAHDGLVADRASDESVRARSPRRTTSMTRRTGAAPREDDRPDGLIGRKVAGHRERLPGDAIEGGPDRGVGTAADRDHPLAVTGEEPVRLPAAATGRAGDGPERREAGQREPRPAVR